MICLIDNYDSFTYNLYQYLGEIKPDVHVFRNDKITIEEIEALAPGHIVLSPGPGRPENAGICVDIVRAFTGKIPILGICLGHQAIGLAFGAKIDYAPEILHGKQTKISHSGKGLFKGLNPSIDAGRYHSLCVSPTNLPNTLAVQAKTDDGVIMAMSHTKAPTYGLQFHPESILTSEGKALIKNFLQEKVWDFTTLLSALMAGKDLSENHASTMMNHIMCGDYSEAQIAALLVALRIKGETEDEITGCAKVMRDKALDASIPDLDMVDTCGTGGDGGNTFNVSTASAFILAAADMPVAKHGNRSVSSQCGSADVLETLGVNVALPPEGVKRCIKKAGIGFMFAPTFHQAMKHAIGVRRSLKIRTIFNILGPLTNPAKANHQVVGVFDKRLLNVYAHVLKRMGSKRAMIVHGQDGMDEITLCDKTFVCELKEDGTIENYTINPEEFGMSLCNIQDLAGGPRKQNAKIILDLLAGERSKKRDLLCLNAGAALYIAGKANTLGSGILLAEQLIDTGKAKDKLDALVKTSNEV